MNTSLWELWKRLFLHTADAADVVRGLLAFYTRKLAALSIAVCGAWLLGVLLFIALVFFDAHFAAYAVLLIVLMVVSLAWLFFALPVLIPTAFLLRAVPEIRQTLHGPAQAIAAIALSVLMLGWVCLLPAVREHPRVILVCLLLLVLLGLGTYLGLMRFSHRAVRVLFAVHLLLPFASFMVPHFLPEVSAALKNWAGAVDWKIAEALAQNDTVPMECDRPLQVFTPTGTPLLYWLRRPDGTLVFFRSDGVDTMTGLRREPLDTAEEVAMLRDHERAVCEAQARAREEALRVQAAQEAAEAERLRQQKHDRDLLRKDIDDLKQIERALVTSRERAAAEARQQAQERADIERARASVFRDLGQLRAAQSRAQEDRAKQEAAARANPEAQASQQRPPTKVSEDTVQDGIPRLDGPQRTPQHGPPPVKNVSGSTRRFDPRAPLPPYPQVTPTR